MFDVIKQMFKHTPKQYFVGVLAAAVLVATPFAVLGHGMAAFGPDRPTMAWSTSSNGADHVVFNSFTGVPNVGDERAFFTGGAVGTDANYVDKVKVKAGDEINMRVWVHNNADPALNNTADQKGVAKDTKIRVALPATTGKVAQATAFISASNATPTEVTDTLDFYGDQDFSLSYEAGTAVFTNDSNPNGVKLSDEIVTNGALLGDKVLDGKLPGCFNYAGWVTFKAKVGTSKITVDKKIRANGETTLKANWQENLAAKPGDTVEWGVIVDNATTTTAKDVILLDQLPQNLDFVPGSVRMFDTNNVNGVTLGDTAIQANGRQLNINLGDFPAETNAYLLFKTKIAGADKLACGQMIITNTAFVKPAGETNQITDTASATVTNDKSCNNPTPTYSCDSLSLIGLTGRKAKFQVAAPVTNGAVVKSVTYDFGDGTTPLVTNAADMLTRDHEYKADGNYIVRVKVTFTVDGKDTVVSNDKCAMPINIKTTAAAQPTTLPSTGAGDVLGVFLGVTAAGAILYYLTAFRRNNQN